MIGKLTANVTSDCLLAAWTHSGTQRSSELVIPDGCQDVIIEVHGDEAARYFISELSNTAYSVELCADVFLMGFRLKPGTSFNEHGLSAYAAHHDFLSLLTGDRLDEFCTRSPVIVQALDCLGSGVSSIADAARDLGVSTRTLQREVKQGTGVTPQFWLSLSRARRACRSLNRFDRLADVADAFGYSDQSHMTREVRRWFGVTPSSISPGTAVYSRLCDSGYY